MSIGQLSNGKSPMGVRLNMAGEVSAMSFISSSISFDMHVSRDPAFRSISEAYRNMYGRRRCIRCKIMHLAQVRELLR